MPTHETVADLVARWDLEGHTPLGAPEYNEIHKRLLFYEHVHYNQYVPTLSPDYRDYENRLRHWINNLPDEQDRRLLLELAPRLLFFSREDFSKLHQAALDGPIRRWVIDDLGLKFEQPDFDAVLSEEIHSHTWYCPISDSMPISDFHHANNIGGIDFRPDWRSLSKFGDPARIMDFMATRTTCSGPKPLKRVVLLEDFVGSGTQMQEALQFVARLPLPVPVLFVPLIICPVGATFGRSLAASYSHVSFDPVLELKPNDMITDSITLDGSLRAAIADLVRRCYSVVEGDRSSAPRPYGEFGFPGPAMNGTGALVVLYSNTPANTLPVVQHHSDTWTPLFPRSARIR